MNSSWIICSMCGHEFDPVGHSACQSCPLQKGCQLVCCPNCGYETVNVNQSRLAQLASRFLNRKQANPSSRSIHR